MDRQNYYDGQSSQLGVDEGYQNNIDNMNENKGYEKVEEF